MSDHLDAPGMRSQRMDARVDICDIYAFQKPKDADRSVLVFNVNPLAPTMADSFSPDAVYELKIDTNGDAIAEIAYRFTFSAKEQDEQLAMVRRVSGEEAKGNGDGGDLLFQDVPVTFDEKATIAESDHHRFFAGIRSDPFFFDLDGYHEGMEFTGTDTFLDKNVFSIVLELPNNALGGNSKVGIWGRVLMPKDGAPFSQIDRMGRPFINVGFTKGNDKEIFNRSEPARDRDLFADKFTDLLASNGYGPEEARRAALTLLPDILDYDPSRPAGYPNGRTLTDDIIDRQLAILTNGAVMTDKVAHHRDLLSTFPYLGPPHSTR